MLSNTMNHLDLPLDGTIKYDIVCLHKKTNSFYKMPFHKHTGYELELYLSGHINLITDKATYKMHKNYLTLIPPETWHRTLSHDTLVPYERVVINIKPNILKKISTPLTDLSKAFFTGGEINIVKLNDEQVSQYVDCCHQLIPIIYSQDYAADIKRRILLEKILLIANSVSPLQGDLPDQNPSLITNIFNFIEANIDGDLSQQAFADHFYLDAAYIGRFFKSYIGMTLHSFVIEKRIEKAKELLMSGCSVSETCSKAGFNNYSSFIRTFKNHVGVAPGQFKKLFQISKK